MTDAEKYVRRTFPNPYLIKNPMGYDYWIYAVKNAFVPIGTGFTEIAAWADAANRLESRKNEKVKP